MVPSQIHGYSPAQDRPERVVVSGIGVVTSIGIGKAPFWTNLLAGTSGIGPVRSFCTRNFPVHYGAEVLDFVGDPFVQRTDLKKMGRASQFAVAAARLALEDGALPIETVDSDQVGVVLGTTSGEPRLIEEVDDLCVKNCIEDIRSDFISQYPCNILAAHVATELGARGEVLTIPTACAAGNYAIAHATDLLRAGRASIILAGGADSFSRITYAGFARLGAISPDLCRPFDRDRKGIIPGEGAAMLLLETYAHAAQRGARIYAEVAGYGLSCDAYHMTASHPEGEGGARAMNTALHSSGVRAEEVDYISAHGTGTPTNDRLETIAIKRVFGSCACRVPISSIKSMLGHAMGAASAIEAACCVLAITEGYVPGTVTLENPDSECDLDFVPGVARRHVVEIAMNNAYALGGIILR